MRGVGRSPLYRTGDPSNLKGPYEPYDSLYDTILCSSLGISKNVGYSNIMKRGVLLQLLDLVRDALLLQLLLRKPRSTEGFVVSRGTC